MNAATRSCGPSRLRRSEVGTRDLRRLEIWLRAAEVFDGHIHASGTGFQLGLEDGGGTIAWIDSDVVGGVPRPYDRPGQVKSMLKTLRFKSACFSTVAPKLRLATVRAILIRCDRSDERALAFDDLQLVRT
jgi:hypothetical protein